MTENNFHKELNPKLWINNDLKPEVARKLKEIANAFIESMEVPRDAIKDIVITGSSASYNYTPHSDIDLHLIVDFDKVHKDCPIVGDYLISKKSEFNNNHDIFIYGVPVEVYAEATDNENIHNGLYSLKNGSWIDKPKKLKPLDNDIAVNAKYNELAKAIKDVADKEESTQLMDKIKRMRKAGLAKEGEFSVENLVFKKLRNEGLIGKLADIKKEEIDKELSLEECYGNILSSIEEMMNTGTTGMMGVQPNPVAGQENPSKYTKQGKHRQKKATMEYKYRKNRSMQKITETMLEIEDTCSRLLGEFTSQNKLSTNEALIKDITTVCEMILRKNEDITKVASASLQKWEDKVNKIKRDLNNFPQGLRNLEKLTKEDELRKAQAKVDNAKKILGFKASAK